MSMVSEFSRGGEGEDLQYDSKHRSGSMGISDGVLKECEETVIELQEA